MFSNQPHNFYRWVSSQKTRNFAILSSLIALLSACNNGATIENWLAADPQLKKTLANSQVPEQVATSVTSLDGSSISSDSALNSSSPTFEQTISLPDDFPIEIPLYPKAQLIEVQPGLTTEKGKTNWESPDSLTQIASYYQQQLKANGWKIIKSFPEDVQQGNNTLTASRENLKVTVSLSQPTTESKDNLISNQFAIAYQPIEELPQLTTSETTNPSENLTEIEPNIETTASAVYFSDLDEASEQLRPYVEDLAKLGILTAYSKVEKVEANKFAPNEPITRRDYARWLVEANNQFHGNAAGEKIHLATKSDRPAFQDISVNDPDFEIIQGLAEAGLIPSMLTDNSNKLLFQPNAPLTREDLLTWKVPLDLRKNLPTASIDAIKQSWGFQDAANISPQALQALFADFQNGDNSNMKRVFGYTTLFQPKKPVTRAEAAASLWYFGFQGDGITASEVVKGESINHSAVNSQP
ncbi:S-layer domain protein [Stanieria sp. NIES-3757]|nr:S-layer domain protein [Stanieria sp. NIES-3757]